jgi:hypothetical protein
MNQQPAVVSKKTLWSGYIMSALPVLLLVFSAVMKLMKPPAIVQGFTQYGFPESQIVPLGIVELVCAIVYVIPGTSFLGAILLTGYLGGAVCANARVGQGVIIPLITGVLVWGGLFMRDPRLRELIPLKR